VEHQIAGLALFFVWVNLVAEVVVVLPQALDGGEDAFKGPRKRGRNSGVLVSLVEFFPEVCWLFLELLLDGRGDLPGKDKIFVNILCARMGGVSIRYQKIASITQDN